jgi:TolA-binding protein
MNLKVKLVLYVLLMGSLAYCAYGIYLTVNGPASYPMLSNLSTNESATTNLSATNNQFVLTNTGSAASDEPTARKASPRMGRLMGFCVGGFLSLVGISLLIAQDLSRFVANRVEDFIFNDDLKGIKDPKYEEAEKIWASGQYLESVRLMREYLDRHPREQYVALRIAEIYEGNLGNYLAAALEYEEILKKKLPPERWGWAAIHLANLYSGKLNKAEEAQTLLHRVINEYGQTAAAKKARERLGIAQPQSALAEPMSEPEPAKQESKDSVRGPNLPPGFRPKK